MRLLVPVRLLVPMRLAAQLEEPCATRRAALVLAALEQEPADAARRCSDQKKMNLPDSVDEKEG